MRCDATENIAGKYELKVSQERKIRSLRTSPLSSSHQDAAEPRIVALQMAKFREQINDDHNNLFCEFSPLNSVPEPHQTIQELLRTSPTEKQSQNSKQDDMMLPTTQ